MGGLKAHVWRKLSLRLWGNAPRFYGKIKGSVFNFRFRLMSILLTGGAGYIGSHTAVELIKSGFDVIIADDLSNSSRLVVDRIAEIAGVTPTFYELDVCDREGLASVFRAHEIDAVVHFAGFKAVGESVAEPLKYYRNNLDAALSVLEVMKDFGCKKFVFSSSATVYGALAHVPFTEDMPTGGCTNPYGWTKYMIEQFLCDACKADASLSVALLRYFNPVGAHPSGLIGENPRGIPNNLMPYVCQVASGLRDHLSIFGNDYDTPDGTGVRDYIHVCDLALGHVAALRFLESAQAGEGEPGSSEGADAGNCSVFNLGSGRGYSVLELVEAFERVNGVSVKREFADRRPGDVAVSYADVSKARDVLGWETKLGLDDMVRDAWNFQANSF